MQTAMSAALLKAGLATKEQAEQAVTIPPVLKQFTVQIQEMERLMDLLSKSGARTSLLDIGTYVAFRAMMGRGEYAEAYDMMLSHLNKKVTQLKLV